MADRRGFLRGLAAASLMASSVTAVVASPAPIPDDWLLVRCAEVLNLEASTNALIEAHPGTDWDRMPGTAEIDKQRLDVLLQIVRCRATTLAGVAAKARVLMTDGVQADYAWIDFISSSMADDVIRLHGGAAAGVMLA